jgi:hypothetical protein
MGVGWVDTIDAGVTVWLDRLEILKFHCEGQITVTRDSIWRYLYGDDTTVEIWQLFYAIYHDCYCAIFTLDISSRVKIMLYQ